MNRWPLNTPRASFRALCTKYSANDGAVTGSPAQGQQNVVCKGLADRDKFPASSTCSLCLRLGDPGLARESKKLHLRARGVCTGVFAERILS